MFHRFSPGRVGRMRGSRLLAVFVLVVTAVVVPATAGHAVLEPDPRALTGEWLSPPFSEGGPDFMPATKEDAARYPTAVSSAVLPDGRVLYFNGFEGTESISYTFLLNPDRWAKDSRARVLDLSGAAPQWTTPTPETGVKGDLFCSDLVMLADGRILIAGGSWWHNEPDLGETGLVEVDGRTETQLFDPSSDAFVQVGSMHYPRWYPSMITLADGRPMIFSGVARLQKNTSLTNIREPEVFSPSELTWSRAGASAERSLPLYARLHLLPNGKLLYPGVGQMWSPFGISYDQVTWNLMAWYDPTANQWQDLGLPTFGARDNAFSVLLPLKPPYTSAEILVGGGTLGTAPGSYLATSLAEIITFTFDGHSQNNPISTRPVASLNSPRWFASGVLLPDGTVLAINGGDSHHQLSPGRDRPVRTPDLYDPATDQWRALSPGSRDRTYHNTAMLLPDGSVLVGGHSPSPLDGGEHNNDAHEQFGTANNFKDPSFEIFRPPYFFKGPRPQINHAPQTIGYGETFAITTPDAENVQSVVLVRLTATTHVFDNDQRSVELEISSRSSGRLSVQSPPNGAVAPPGVYYLFINTATADGLVPSEAAIVTVAP